MTESSTCESGVPKAPASVDAVVKRIDEISTLPQVALKVIDITKDPHSGASDLKHVVEGDPALSSRVLRSVNSAAYSLRSKITNLQQAISYLGFSEIRNLALTASVAKIFKKDETIGSYQRTSLWRHMVSVGICGRLVAMRLRLPDFEDCFLAGMLHDIGIVLEDQHIHANFRYVIETMTEDTTLADAEKAHLGFDHTILGSRIAEQWRFPPVIQAAIRYHHMAENYRGEKAPVVQCVEVANVICTLKGITSIGRKVVKPSMEVFQSLDLQKEDVAVLADDLDSELSRNECLFET